MAIPQGFVQELLTRIDLVEVIGRYVKLKKTGASFTGLCPFHAEKSPSFNVSPSKQLFHCFGCGKSGSAIGFLMDHTGLGYVEAVEDLARQAGLSVPREDISPAQRALQEAQQQRKLSLAEVMEQAAQAYAQQLKKDTSAQNYLKARGLTGLIAKRFGLGYAPPGWHHLSSVFAHYDDPLLAEAGLVLAQSEADGSTRRWDRFRDRVMFPIRNIKGECIAFGGRVLTDEKPKYLNSPETPLFTKGQELYGLFEARSAIRSAGYALVTEGYMDVVALAQLGFAQAVATLGTACTTDHVRKLLRLTDCVVFSFDGDAAGRAAARKAMLAALPFASDTRSLKFLFLPPEHDPDSFIRAHGASAFAHQVTQAQPLSTFLLDVAREGCNLEHAEGRARMLAQAQPLWDALPPGALKQQILSALAEQAQSQPAGVLGNWRRSGGGGDGVHQTNPMTGGWGDARRARSGTRRSRHSLPASRADHAARLLLTHMHALDGLTPEDLQILAQQPEPHGELFRWLQAQWLEAGPQPWAALQAGLQDQPALPLAQRLMAPEGPAEPARPEDDAPAAADVRQELRDLLDRLLIEHLKAEETRAIERAKQDPTALSDYRALQTRRRAIESRPLAHL